MVSSSGHTRGVFDPENMNGDRDFGSLSFYCHSKLYNVWHKHVCVCVCVGYERLFLSVQVMMAYALQRRLQNVGVTVSSLHPGLVSMWWCF